MAGPESQIEWYLARDGAQHGPLSDTEMRKVVEFGHLKSTDLVWRAGFPEWRPSIQVFPELGQPRPPQATRPAAEPQPMVAAPATQPEQGRQPFSSDHAAAAGIRSDRDPATAIQASNNAQPVAPIAQNIQNTQTPAAQPDEPRTAGLQRGLRRLGPSPLGPSPLGPSPLGIAPAADARGARQVTSFQADHSGQPLQQDQLTTGRDRRGANRNAALPDGGQQQPAPYATGSPAHRSRPSQGADDRRGGAAPRDQSSRSDDEDDDEASATPRRGVLRTAAIAASVLIVLGTGWVGWQNRSALPGMSAIGGVMLARISASPSAETYQAPPFVADGATRDDIDRALQKTALWRLLKRDYADWYGERVGDIERMRTQKADEKTISKFIADVVVVQRRKTAPIALSSSREHLRQIATAFLGNLNQLASRDAQTCFGFISFGEASAYMLELSKTSTFAEPLQRQLTAIFEAVADGRKQPNYYAATRRTDYDVLTAELTARGWTQDDLMTFSDARRLSSSPPEKVCRMVQDWFTVQLSLKDPELQSRLLAESLKPLVQG